MHTDARMAHDIAKSNVQSEKRATRITVTLPQENYERLMELSRVRKVSASWLVRDAVDRYLAADTPLFTPPLDLASAPEKS